MDHQITTDPATSGDSTTPENNPRAHVEAGLVSKYVYNWKKITSNKFILNIIENGYKIQFLDNPSFPKSIISNPKSHDNIFSINQQVSRLLDMGAISKVKPIQNQVLSRIFTVKKSNGEDRMILDLSLINLLINKVSFKMETLAHVKDLISPSDYLASIDLSDAYFSICMNKDSKKYLRFQIKDEIFEFNVLPFGMTSSPRIFTKILKVPIVHLRSLGIKVSAYLDDIFICAPSYSLLKSQIKITIDLLISLGFTPNYKKCNLIPSHILTHLGFVWNSETMTISVPLNKINKCKSLASSIVSSPCTLRQLSSFIGLLNSLVPGFQLAPMHFRQLQFLQTKYIKRSVPWDSLVSLDEPSISDLLWWQNCPKNLPSADIKERNSNITLTTDSSTTGWGGVLSTGESIAGQWSPEFLSAHINWLELKAVELSIIHFLPLIQNKNLTIFSDNFTAVTFINRIGGTHSKSLCSLALNIWKFLFTYDITCRSIHIPGMENCEADFLSRRISLSNEYFLSPQAFDEILTKISFAPEIDLFASQANHKLNTYVSWQPDPLSCKTNAFSFIWPDNIYLFPPINLISKCVQKVITDEVTNALLITPAWPGLISLSKIIDLMSNSPIYISPQFLEGPLPTRRPFALMAWSISSNRATQMGYQKKLFPTSFKASQTQHFHLISATGGNLLRSLQKKGHTVVLL